jgi:uncharacterized protein
VDPAEARPADGSEGPDSTWAPPGESPSIGVPAIPTSPDPSRTPLAVPSADLTPQTAVLEPPMSPAMLAPLQLAPRPAQDPRPPAHGASAEPNEQAGPATGASVLDGTMRVEEPAWFSEEIVSKLKAYVYLLVDPRTGRAFFAGRGRGNHCFFHLAAARGDRPAPDQRPDFPALDRIRDIESAGRPVRIDILRHGLSGPEADLVGAAVNEALGLPVAPGSSGQRRSVVDVGSALAKRAKFKRTHQVVLLRVGATGTEASYEVARHHWRIATRWTDPESPRSPRHAVVVVGELVVAVYRITGWERSGPSAPGTARSADRFSFIGSPDPEVEGRYLGRSVAAYLGPGAPSPVTYVWCGPHWVNNSR